MKSENFQKSGKPFPSVHIIRYLFPLIILGLAVHLILPQITSLPHAYQVIRNMALWAVLLAIVAQVSSYLGSGYLLKALVRLSGSALSILSGTVITLAGASFGMVAGGLVGSSAATYRWMRKRKVRSEAATLAGTMPALFDNGVLLLVSLVGLVHLLIVHQLSRLQGISFILILAILVGLAGLLLWGLRKREALVHLAENTSRHWSSFRHREYQSQKTENWLAGLFKAADLLLAKGWRGPLIGTSLNVGFDMLTLYFLFIAAGHPISFGMLLTGYGLPLLLGKMAFMVPGGIGVIESTMTVLYTSLGVPDATTVVVVLAYRILSFWLPLLLGFPLILILQKKK
jgi:uncharacterized protein (TIRG00374 family)